MYAILSENQSSVVLSNSGGGGDDDNDGGGGGSTREVRGADAQRARRSRDCAIASHRAPRRLSLTDTQLSVPRRPPRRVNVKDCHSCMSVHRNSFFFFSRIGIYPANNRSCAQLGNVVFLEASDEKLRCFERGETKAKKKRQKEKKASQVKEDLRRGDEKLRCFERGETETKEKKRSVSC